MSNYAQISQFGSNAYSAVNNPLSYCIGSVLDQKFNHGSSAAMVNGQHTKPCQKFMADYCAGGWDSACEAMSKNNNVSFPNTLQSCDASTGVGCLSINAGDVLVRNTAAVKYLKDMLNCTKKYEPFDPTVATSPMIASWVSNCGRGCVPVYAVDPKTIDDDVVMDKIIARPKIAIDILINIKNTMTREGTFSSLAGTKLGNFYAKNNM